MAEKQPQKNNTTKAKKSNNQKKQTNKPAPKKKTQVKEPLRSQDKKNEVNKICPLNPTIEKTSSKLDMKNIKPKTTICKHCRIELAEGLINCPICLKKQRTRNGVIIIGILSFVLLTGIIITHLIERHFDGQECEIDYIFTSELVTYEQLIESPERFLNTNVKVIGLVTSVDETNLSNGNELVVRMNVNLFEGDSEQFVNFEYLDRDSRFVLMPDDLVTIYGYFTLIDGDEPFIEVRHLILGT